MPMHDWTRVDTGIYQSFHHTWISEISRSLNRGLLPAAMYAILENDEAGYGSDQILDNGVDPSADFHRRKKSSIAVRHVSGDRIVAMIEIVSPGNKNNANAFKAFVDKACELLEHRIHLLLIDPFPPGRRDPNGIHAAIWSMVDDEPFVVDLARPLTFVAYQCSLNTQAYIETIAVGEPVPEMPLFLNPESHILVPLESTYQSAWETLPARWQRVVDPNR
jgi:Protein of unknown function (DUF4058)